MHDIKFPIPTSYRQLLTLSFYNFKLEWFLAVIINLFVTSNTLVFILITNYIIANVYYFSMSDLLFIFIITLLLFIALGFLEYYSNLHIKNFNLQLSNSCISALLYHLLHTSTELIKLHSYSAISQHVREYETSISNCLIQVISLFRTCLNLLVLLIFIGYTNFYIGLLCSFVLGILIFFKWKLFPLVFDNFINYLIADNQANTTMNEILLHIYKIRNTCLESKMLQAWLQKSIKAKTFLQRSICFDIWLWLFDETLILIIILMLFMCIYIQFNTTTNFLLLTLCISQFTMQVTSLSQALINIFNDIPVLSRVKYLIQNQASNNGNIIIDNINTLQFRNITFAHEKHDPLLKNINLLIKSQQFVGIIGKSGVGKSTLFNLLLGLETNYNGRIEINGFDIKSISSHSLQNQMGVVLQQSSLFPGTIFYNIAINKRISLSEAWQLAQFVGLDADIRVMPMQMYTYISEDAGDSISGGQRQKILLARALAMKPNILFLDEATSALDNNSQKLIFDNLRKLKIILVVIAHRLTTLEGADVIYKLEDGMLHESKITFHPPTQYMY